MSYNFYFASSNLSKLQRLKKVVSKISNDVNIEKVPDFVDIEEVANNSLQNAKDKLKPYEGVYDIPVISNDSSLFFEGLDFNPTHIKREAIKSSGKSEDELTQKDIASLMQEFYITLAKKNNGQLPFYYLDSWAMLLPDGTVIVDEYKREYILTSTPSGELDIYFPMRNLYISKKTGKYINEQNEDDFHIEFEDQRNLLKSFLEKWEISLQKKN